MVLKCVWKILISIGSSYPYKYRWSVCITKWSAVSSSGQDCYAKSKERTSNSGDIYRIDC